MSADPKAGRERFNPNVPVPTRHEPTKKNPGDVVITSWGTFVIDKDGVAVLKQ